MIADQFDSPIGTEAERAGAEIPPGDWYCSNAFGNYYQLKPGVFAYHTGADLLLWPGGGAHEPIYAAANGIVTFAARVLNSTWGNVIVVKHTLPDGAVVYSRYGHVENMLVAAGDEIARSEQIASEGNAFGQFAYHLHFDISPTAQLATRPTDWPGLDIARLRRDYVDPLVFIREHREVNVVATIEELKAVRLKAQAVVSDLDALIGAPVWTPNYITTENLNVRNAPVYGAVIKVLPAGTDVLVTEVLNGWATITQPVVGYCSATYLRPKA